MATESYQTQLERVQSAIAAIENGAQEYSVGGLAPRTFKKADLQTLYKREQQLRKLANREARGSAIRTARYEHG